MRTFQRMALSNSWRILKQQQIGPLIKKIFQVVSMKPVEKALIFSKIDIKSNKFLFGKKTQDLFENPIIDNENPVITV